MRECPFCDFDEGWVQETESGFKVVCKVCGSSGPESKTHEGAQKKWDGILREIDAPDEFEKALNEYSNFERGQDSKRALGLGITQKIFNKTSGAYSFSSYGKKNWKDIIDWLLSEGYNEEKIILILKSKLLRWARDYKSTRGLATLENFKEFASKTWQGENYIDVFIRDETNSNSDNIKEDAMGGVSAPMSTLNNVPGVGNATPASTAAMTGAQQYDQSAIGSGDLWGATTKKKKKKKKKKNKRKKVIEHRISTLDEYANQIK